MTNNNNNNCNLVLLLLLILARESKRPACTVKTPASLLYREHILCSIENTYSQRTNSTENTFCENTGICRSATARARTRTHTHTHARTHTNTTHAHHTHAHAHCLPPRTRSSNEMGTCWNWRLCQYCRTRS